jgi:hypothetical protein
MSLYIIMFISVCMFTFWLYVLCMSFYDWVTSLNMISINCILLPSDHMLSLFLMGKTPLCIHTIFYWSIHQLWGIWVVSIAWLLWIMLQWTSVYKCLYCILIYICLGRYPGTVSLDNVAALSSACSGITILLSIMDVPVCIPTYSV